MARLIPSIVESSKGRYKYPRQPPAVMGKLLSDHQETNAFSYSRTWEEIERMLDKAERRKNYHEMHMNDTEMDRPQRMFHARNFKALEGVIKTLRWTLGDKNVTHPLK